jgi:hypothetical protein
LPQASLDFNQHKVDLIAMFVSFQKGELPLFHLNYGKIVLLPKKEDATQIQQYRPICLFNVSFKVFTKVETNRISEIAENVVKPTQIAFMRVDLFWRGRLFYKRPYMNFIARRWMVFCLKSILKKRMIK